MDRAQDEPSHRAVVDVWLLRSIEHRSNAEVVRLFHAAFDAVWQRAVTPLGSVTLKAITVRVLHHATDRHRFLAAINPYPNGDSRWKELLQERLMAVPRSELIEGLRFGLVELLEVIGALTAEILSGELHAALMETAGAGSRGLPTTADDKELR